MMMIPKRQNKDSDTREQILESAIRIFSRFPFHKASLRMIAHEAAIIHTVIVYHFKTKDNLYREVLRRIVTRHFHVIKPYLADLALSKPLASRNAIAALAGILDATLNCLYDDAFEGKSSVHILLLETCYPTPGFNELWEKRHSRYYRLLIEMIMTINGCYDRKTAIFKFRQILGLIASCHVGEPVDYGVDSKRGRERYKKGVIDNVFSLLETSAPLESHEN